MPSKAEILFAFHKPLALFISLILFQAYFYFKPFAWIVPFIEDSLLAYLNFLGDYSFIISLIIIVVVSALTDLAVTHGKRR